MDIVHEEEDTMDLETFIISVDTIGRKKGKT